MRGVMSIRAWLLMCLCTVACCRGALAAVSVDWAIPAATAAGLAPSYQSCAGPSSQLAFTPPFGVNATTGDLQWPGGKFWPSEALIEDAARVVDASANACLVTSSRQSIYACFYTALRGQVSGMSAADAHNIAHVIASGNITSATRVAGSFLESLAIGFACYPEFYLEQFRSTVSFNVDAGTCSNLTGNTQIACLLGETLYTSQTLAFIGAYPIYRDCVIAQFDQDPAFFQGDLTAIRRAIYPCVPIFHRNRVSFGIGSLIPDTVSVALTVLENPYAVPVAVPVAAPVQRPNLSEYCTPVGRRIMTIIFLMPTVDDKNIYPSEADMAQIGAFDPTCTVYTNLILQLTPFNNPAILTNAVWCDKLAQRYENVATADNCLAALQGGISRASVVCSFFDIYQAAGKVSLIVQEQCTAAPVPTPVAVPVPTPVPTPVAAPVAVPVPTPVAAPVAVPAFPNISTPTVCLWPPNNKIYALNNITQAVHALVRDAAVRQGIAFSSNASVVLPNGRCSILTPPRNRQGHYLPLLGRRDWDPEDDDERCGVACLVSNGTVFVLAAKGDQGRARVYVIQARVNNALNVTVHITIPKCNSDACRRAACANETLLFINATRVASLPHVRTHASSAAAAPTAVLALDATHHQRRAVSTVSVVNETEWILDMSTMDADETHGFATSIDAERDRDAQPHPQGGMTRSEIAARMAHDAAAASSSHTLSGGAIAAIVIGSVAGAILLWAFLAYIVEIRALQIGHRTRRTRRPATSYVPLTDDDL